MTLSLLTSSFSFVWLHSVGFLHLAAARTNEHFRDRSFHYWKNILSVSPYCHFLYLGSISIYGQKSEMSLSTRSSTLCVLSCAGQGQNLFLTWLSFPLPNSSLPYGQQHLLVEAIHIIHLRLLPKVPSGSVHQGYVSLTFVTFSVGIWKESKNTFLISQLLMTLCHGITLWSNYMNSFTSCSSQSCACAIP